MNKKIALYFVGLDNPALDQVEFYHPIQKEVYLSVRGKTSGAYETDRTFQWTNAVQAVAILFLRLALYRIDKYTSEIPPPRPSLEGGKGSIVASLDYALDKQPAWLLDMFGIDASERAYFKNLITRSNPGLRRDGTTRIGLRADEFEPNGINIYWNSDKPIESQKILQLLRTLEKATGTLSADEIRHQVENDRRPTNSSSQDNDDPARPQNRPSPHAAVFKTPFLQQGMLGADAYVRCYEQDSRGALVVSFVPYEELDRQRRVPIRIHSSCAPSEALGAIDCDCKSQLDSAFSYLREKQGVLIYLEQEGRGAGLFSKYQGMSISAKTGVDTYEAYRRMSLSVDLRTYSLVNTILQDLGITKISLLTNNPEKSRELTNFGLDIETRPCFGVLSPQNLSYLYSKMTHGEHALQKLFIPATESLYLLESQRINQSLKRTWIFGGDDTLWEDNIIYEDIIRLFIDHISRHVSFPRDQVRQRLDEIETKVIPEMGYGGPGFLVSLKKTFELICSESGISIPPPVDLFDSVLKRLSLIATEISFRTIEVLRKIRKSGDGLILFVQGPYELQLQKISQSRLGEFFHAIALVPEKNINAFKKLISSISFQADSYVVVGNSLRTDIAPAIELGLEAIYYNNPNSWQLLNQADCRPDGYKEITQLEEILSIYR